MSNRMCGRNYGVTSKTLLSFSTSNTSINHTFNLENCDYQKENQENAKKIL